MFIWRLSKYVDLFGRGGLAAHGRWHTSPKAVAYCSDDAYTAYKEILNQFVLADLIPEDMKLLKIVCPTAVEIETVDPAHIHPSWNDPSTGWQICRPIGDEWLLSGRTAVLKVPSAARRGSFNFLINPAAFRADHVQVTEVFDQPFPEFATRDQG